MYTGETYGSKSAIALTGIVLGIVGLTGCGLGPELKPGVESVVVDHDHDPAYTTVILVGKVPVVQYHPERWALEIEQCGRNSDEYADKNGCIQAWQEVDEKTYEAQPIGSTIVMSE